MTDEDEAPTYHWRAGRSGALCGQRIRITGVGEYQPRADLAGASGMLTNPLPETAALHPHPEHVVAGVYLDQWVTVRPNMPGLVPDIANLYDGDTFEVVDETADDLYRPARRDPNTGGSETSGLPQPVYREHVERPAEFAFSVRYIETRTPLVHDLEPEPKHPSRSFLEPDPDTIHDLSFSLVRGGVIEPSYSATFHHVTEYAHPAAINAFHLVSQRLDREADGREQIVRTGYYEVWRCWFWSRDPVASEVPPEVIARLEAARDKWLRRLDER